MTDIARQELARGLVVELFRRSRLVAKQRRGAASDPGRGARLNDRKVEDEAMTVGLDDLVEGQLLLSAGRKRHARVRAV